MGPHAFIVLFFLNPRFGFVLASLRLYYLGSWLLLACLGSVRHYKIEKTDALSLVLGPTCDSLLTAAAAAVGPVSFFQRNDG